LVWKNKWSRRQQQQQKRKDEERLALLGLVEWGWKKTRTYKKERGTLQKKNKQTKLAP